MAGCRVACCAAGGGAGPAVLSPEQMWAAVLMLQESDRGDRGAEAEGCCAFVLLPLCKQQGSDAGAGAEGTRATSVLRCSCALFVPDLCLCR